MHLCASKYFNCADARSDHPGLGDSSISSLSGPSVKESRGPLFPIPIDISVPFVGILVAPFICYSNFTFGRSGQASIEFFLRLYEQDQDNG